MKMGYGMWVAILGILAIIIGGVTYEEYHHTGRTAGEAGIASGVILIILGLAWWMMKDRSTLKPATPQPTQPAKTL